LKLLIFGATGFLGSTLSSMAERLNLQVLGTSRHCNEKQNIIKLDVTDKHSMKNVMESFDPDVVVWALLSRNHEDVLVDFGLANLLCDIKEKTKLIFLSTDAIFPGAKGGYKETDKPILLSAEVLLAKYVNAKIKAEKKITACHHNHAIIRTGPLYGRDANGNIEARTQKIITEKEEKKYTEAPANLYKTFVHIEDLTKAIMEIIFNNITGKIHLGPENKESYFSFYQKRLNVLGIDSDRIIPIKNANRNENYVPMDTSLDTQKARDILKTSFRNVHCRIYNDREVWSGYKNIRPWGNTMDTNLIIELKTKEDILEAFSIMKQLRTHLDEITYLDLVAEARETDGYKIFALIDQEEMVAVIGFKPMITLYYGRIVWVCDLVTAKNCRSKGHGEKLLSYVHTWAKDHDYISVALSSGLQREDAHRFYEEKMDYDKVSYVFKHSFK